MHRIKKYIGWLHSLFFQSAQKTLSNILMEEDNAGDIEKWLFKESTNFDCGGRVKFAHEGMQDKWWEVIFIFSQK